MACRLPLMALLVLLISIAIAMQHLQLLPCCAAAISVDGASLLAAMEAWKVNFSTWRAGSDPCQGWEHVECDSSLRVTKLDLHSTGISGPIPAELSNLQQLVYLDLSNPRNATPPINGITGDLSPLGLLSNLQSLNLSFNDIRLNSFPAAVLNLTKLTDLRIDNNYLSGNIPKELSQLSNLQYLYLGNNSMLGPLPEELGELINLLELSLWNNDFYSKIPPQWSKLVNLRYLNLHDCHLYGGLPPEFGNLMNLQNLSLYRNYLTGSIPDTWRNLRSLKILYLNKNFLTKYFPSWIEDLPYLYIITLNENYFYGNVPSLQNKVQYITLTCNYFSGAAPKVPSKLHLNQTGNCFATSDPNEKILCSQQYFNCQEFVQQVSNGGCPACPEVPQMQVLEDRTTCVCTIAETGGPSSSTNRKLVGSLVGVGGFLLIFMSGLWFLWIRSSKIKFPSSHIFEPLDLWKGPDGVQRFSLHDLSRATGDFSSTHEIGHGGFGKVYYGVVDGKKVAIKRAHSSSIQSTSGFHNEVLLLSRLHHRNLVQLVGFCEDDGIQILIYEYMPNGNLHSVLFKNQSGLALDWLRRLDIAIGVAQGLEYLHSFADPPVIHRDVKPSNILLDNNWVAKLADFGISKVAPEFETDVATRPAGTVGYIDPQYMLREHLTTASDVYSFGMVLLELITGQKAVDNKRLEEHNLVEWVKLKLMTEGLECIIDPQLGDRYPEQVYHDIVRLAVDCASFESKDRPSMKAVVTILDACRWSVSPHLLQLAASDRERVALEAEEGYSTSEASQEWLTKDTPSSSAAANNSVSLSVVSPR